jgi:hypothetical protein
LFRKKDLEKTKNVNPSDLEKTKNVNPSIEKGK